MSIDVQVTGVQEALKALDKYLQRKRSQLVSVVAESSLNIKKEAVSLAPRDLGLLKKSINYEVQDKPKRITGVVHSQAPYSADVEFGTEPHMPEYKALKGWSQRHGLPTAAVVRKIAREGTPAQPFMNPAIQMEKVPFANSVSRVMSSL